MKINKSKQQACLSIDKQQFEKKSKFDKSCLPPEQVFQEQL